MSDSLECVFDHPEPNINDARDNFWVRGPDKGLGLG